MNLTLLLLSVLPLPGFGQAPPLDALQETHRVLLVFTPSAQDGRFTQQQSFFEGHAAAMKERDLVLVVGAAPERQRFKVAPVEFTVILIGKDGGEKMRSHQPVTAERLERTIDAMPMRQDEMRR